jgi:20S proteasome alpha/beta subunit
MDNNKVYLHKKQRKDMTLIIGAKCTDGVVLVADKRIVEGTDITIGDKITLLPFGIVVAGAGVGEVTDKFNERIPFVLEERKNLNYKQIKEQNPDLEVNLEEVPFYFRPYEFLEDCEGLVFQLHERYQRPLQVLVATGNNQNAELNYIDNEGFLTSKRRTYMAIGSGSPYANLLLKKLWNKDLTMSKMAKLGKFIIDLISDIQIDTYVGGGTQIMFIPNFPTDFDKLSEEKKQKYLPQELKIDFDDSDLIKEYYKFLEEIREKIGD